VQGVANAAYLEGFLFSGLLGVAPYCVPGGIRVVSKGHRSSSGVMSVVRGYSAAESSASNMHVWGILGSLARW
jgi:hypothetical protein